MRSWQGPQGPCQDLILPISPCRSHSPFAFIQYTFAFLGTMCPVYDTLSVALLLSSNLLNMNTQDLLLHRKELQSIFSILEQTLNSLSRIDCSEVTIPAAAKAQYPQSLASNCQSTTLIHNSQRSVGNARALDIYLSNLSAILLLTIQNIVDLSLMLPLSIHKYKTKKRVSLFIKSLEDFSTKIYIFLDQNTVSVISISFS